MASFNDLFIFSKVVAQNGFTGAAKSLGIARSSVCRRVSHLEEQLGMRLVQRTTRQFAVTDFGMEFYRYCARMVAEGEAAYAMAANARATPAGTIRVSCPTLIAQVLVASLIPRFVEEHPQVRIAMDTVDRKVDIDENFDLCIRVRQIPSEDSGLIMRQLGTFQNVLVASRAFLERHGRPGSPGEMSRLATLSYGPVQGPHIWRLVSPEGQEIQLRHEPVFVADDINVVKQAAIRGLGVVQLPLCLCLTEIRQTLLEMVLADFPAPLCEIQATFPSRRGMVPAVRSFIDFLGTHCVSEVADRHIKRHKAAGDREGIRFATNSVPLEEVVFGKLPPDTTRNVLAPDRKGRKRTRSPSKGVEEKTLVS